MKNGSVRRTIEVEQHVPGKRYKRVRVPRIAHLALIQTDGRIGNVADVGKATATNMTRAGAALLADNQEVLVEKPSGIRWLFRRNTRNGR